MQVLKSYIDIQPTVYRPGYMAIIWCHGRVWQVITGRDYHDTKAEAEAWAEAHGAELLP